MSTFYDSMQRLADGLLGDFEQGSVIVTRLVKDASNPNTPWTPGEARIERQYRVSASVSGVAKKFVDGTNVIMSDIQAICAVSATNILTGEVVKLTPTMTDTINIDGGEPKKPKSIVQVPAAGTPVVFIIILAS